MNEALNDDVLIGIIYDTSINVFFVPKEVIYQ